MTTTGLINRLRQFVLEHDLAPFYLVGSSFGGLVGMNYASRFGGVSGALLLAPALSYSTMASSDEEDQKWRRQGYINVEHYAFEQHLKLRYEFEVDGRLYAEPAPPAGPVTIIHGSKDEVVPVESSQSYEADYPDLVQLIEVDAGHDLNGHLDLIGQQLEAVLGR